MSPSVTVIDYGIGNILSVMRAFEHCGGAVTLSGDADLIRNSQRLVLPGVGAFADGMKGLRDRGLINVVRDYATSGRPLLGICLGMQMLATTSEEFGQHQGLDIIPGRVVPVPPTGVSGEAHKIPHIGWAPLQMAAGQPGWKGTIMSEVAAGESVYLVHSFMMETQDPLHRLADFDYDGRIVAATVRRQNVYGCQFHPEKSGEVGLKILRGFLRQEAES